MLFKHIYVHSSTIALVHMYIYIYKDFIYVLRETHLKISWDVYMCMMYVETNDTKVSNMFELQVYPLVCIYPHCIYA